MTGTYSIIFTPRITNNAAKSSNVNFEKYMAVTVPKPIANPRIKRTATIL
jgi:hypothetical protein